MWSLSGPGHCLVLLHWDFSPSPFPTFREGKRTAPRYEVSVQSLVRHVQNKTKEIDDSVSVTFCCRHQFGEHDRPNFVYIPRMSNFHSGPLLSPTRTDDVQINVSIKRLKVNRQQEQSSLYQTFPALIVLQDQKSRENMWILIYPKPNTLNMTWPTAVAENCIFIFQIHTILMQCNLETLPYE